MQEIPIYAVKDQKLQVVLNEKTYDLTINYVEKYDYFTISIDLDGESVISNRVATLDRNILIDAFGLGSVLGLFNVGEVEEPTYEDFGDGIKLIYEG